MARGDPLDIVYIECVSWPQSIFVAVIAMLILYHLHAFSITSRPVADTLDDLVLEPVTDLTELQRTAAGLRAGGCLAPRETLPQCDRWLRAPAG